MNRIVSALIGAAALLGAGPAMAADEWWPEGGEEIAYTMYKGGEKVGKSKISFEVEDGKVISVQDSRMQLDFGGIDVVTRFVFREWWTAGAEPTFVKMTSHGQAKGGPEKRRFTLKAEPNDAGKLIVSSPRHGDREAVAGTQPSTFWHLNHILAYEVFDPFTGGFAALSFDNLGPQKLKFDDGEGECLAFNLHVKLKSRDEIGELPPGVDRDKVPLERSFKAWFEPDGVMCALVMDTPMGSVAMVREYRKTE